MKLLTPYRLILLNGLLRKFRSNYTFWKINNTWFIFKDHHKSRATGFIYNEIIKGFYTPQQDLNPGDIVLDLGAHVGMFSIPLAKANPLTDFICIEANEKNAINLKYNIKKNKIDNIIVIVRPVGTHGQLVKSLMNTNNSGASVVEATTELVYLNARCVGIDTLLGITGKSLKLLKCDIEGSEYDLFYSKQHLTRIPEIMIELHNKSGTMADEGQLLRLKEWIEKVNKLNTISVNSPLGNYNTRNGQRF